MRAIEEELRYNEVTIDTSSHENRKETDWEICKVRQSEFWSTARVFYEISGCASYEKMKLKKWDQKIKDKLGKRDDDELLPHWYHSSTLTVCKYIFVHFKV